MEYLERYYVLIAFTAYLFEPGFNPDSHHQASLAHWMKRRPELYRSALLLETSVTSSHTPAAGTMYYMIHVAVCMYNSVFRLVLSLTAVYTQVVL